MPAIGETIAGSGFKMGPGGKGSNQSVAAARVGGAVNFISKIGRDAFGDIALATWQNEGVNAHVIRSPEEPTGAAFIYVNDRTGENAIIVVPGAAATITPRDVEDAAAVIRGAHVFMTQLEQPVPAARRGLEIARAAGVTTVFNPAPAEAFDEGLYKLCDYITPNESEAAALVGFPVVSVEDAIRAGDALLAKGVGAAVVTLGDKGALFHAAGLSVARAGLPRRTGGRDDRRGRCLQRRLCGSAGPRARPGRSRPLRLRRRRHLRHPSRHRAVDADAGRGRSAAGKVM